MAKYLELLRYRACILPTTATPFYLEPAAILNEGHHLIISRHEIGAAVLSDQDGAAGIAQSRGFIPVPSIDMSIQEPRSKGIACAQDILYLYREARHIDAHSTLCARHKMDSGACSAAFLHEYARSQVQ